MATDSATAAAMMAAGVVSFCSHEVAVFLPGGGGGGGGGRGTGAGGYAGGGFT